MPFRKKNRTLLYRSSWRYYLKRPLYLLFSVLGVALGVALVVGIDMASQSARQAFSLSTQSITGKASHRIINSEQVLSESIYVQLRNKFGLRKAAPLIKQMVQFTSDDKNKWVDAQLIGIDTFSEADIRSWQQGMVESLANGTLQRLLTEPNTVLVESNFLSQYHFHVGDYINLSINGQAHSLLIIGFYNAPQAYQTQLTNWLICDISTAQEILNLQGAITQIDLQLDSEHMPVIKQIKQFLPEGVQLVKVDEHAKAIARLSQSFELNLTALSLLGLLVAMFLIYNPLCQHTCRLKNLVLGDKNGKIYPGI